MKNHEIETDRAKNLSRRKFLAKGGYFSLIALIGSASLLARPNSAKAAKMSKQAAGYRNSPRGGQKCANCRYFYARSRKCSIVAGKFSPNGWCRLWG